jgi:hypothetical protein
MGLPNYFDIHSNVQFLPYSVTHLFMRYCLFTGLDQICHERRSFWNIFLDGLLSEAHSLVEWDQPNRTILEAQNDFIAGLDL